MKTLEEIFSENLARFRQPKTQEVFSEELGIPLPTYKRYEAGENIPQGKNRQKLVEALHVPESHLFVDWDAFQPKSGITPQQALKVLEQALSERQAPPAQPPNLPILPASLSWAEKVALATENNPSFRKRINRLLGFPDDAAGADDSEETG